MQELGRYGAKTATRGVEEPRKVWCEGGNKRYGGGAGEGSVAVRGKVSCMSSLTPLTLVSIISEGVHCWMCLPS